ncbi:Adenylate isopentenyltransferase 6 [Forsythia ovata]|uniref:Adenylate isopentenyltransferase 6 n=1 Tax=Forsythia ovata TaxID=205694 RepID=A0ABD1WA54_9LAMI
MTTNTTNAAGSRRNKKIVVILGATGSGKSKLSVDLASKFFTSSEIINSDKIQVYSGLDITTNKIPLHERENVHHHLLGEFHPSDSHPEFTPSDFRSYGAATISKILSRQKIPIIAGGSNSFIYALLAEKFSPAIDVFSDSDSINSVFSKQVRYNCCFLWVDVSLPVLNQYLVKRVDDMLDSGMFEELAEFFNDPDSDSVSQSGLRKAIGVPEFERYFKIFKNKAVADVRNSVAYEEAVKAVKDNTCQLAKRQLEKILRLRDAAGWDLKRIDATAAFRAKVTGKRVADIWERQVVEPSVKIVKRFLME